MQFDITLILACLNVFLLVIMGLQVVRLRERQQEISDEADEHVQEIQQTIAQDTAHHAEENSALQGVFQQAVTKIDGEAEELVREVKIARLGFAESLKDAQSDILAKMKKEIEREFATHSKEMREIYSKQIKQHVDDSDDFLETMKGEKLGQLNEHIGTIVNQVIKDVLRLKISQEDHMVLARQALEKMVNNRDGPTTRPPGT